MPRQTTQLTTEEIKEQSDKLIAELASEIHSPAYLHRRIAHFERRFRDTGDPLFVWAARGIARTWLRGENFSWIDEYLDGAGARLMALNPPKAGVNNAIAKALGFDTTRG